MIGPGELLLSQQDICVAVQEYLDKRWTVESPVVREVVGSWTMSNGTAGFKVSLEGNKLFVTGST